MIYELYDVFYSKYKPSNAFVVAKVEGKGSNLRQQSKLSLPKHIKYLKCFSLPAL